MAMTMKTEGLAELSSRISRLADKAELVAKKSLFKGAGVVADAFGQAVSSIKTEPFQGKKDMRLPSPEEKGALVGRTGIAVFKGTGSEINTLIGVTEAGGYTYIGGRKVAVREIARSINSGTSFMQKQPVFRRAASKAKTSATREMIREADEIFEEIINGSG